MEDFHILQSRGLDTINVQHLHNLSVHLTVIEGKGDIFNISVVFLNLTTEQFEDLCDIERLKLPVVVSSLIMKQKQFNISMVTVDSFTIADNCQLTWECTADQSNAA
jgi:hypothetical protein